MSSLPASTPDRGYLPPGIHPAPHEEIRERFVTRLASALEGGTFHREKLFAGYEQMIAALQLVGLPAEQWIGGSFVSECKTPRDIDLVNYCDVQSYETLAPELKVMISKFFQGEYTAKFCHCDSYFAPLPPPEHRTNEDFLIVRAYWEKELGNDRNGHAKGIISRLVEALVETELKEVANADAA